MSEKKHPKGILKKSEKSTRQYSNVRNKYHRVPNEPLPSIAFNPETTVRTVPRLAFGNPFLLNPPNNYINAKSGTRVQNIRRRNSGEKYSRAMIGFNHPLNEASTIANFNHQRIGRVKTYNGRRRTSSATAGPIEAELQPRYGTKENGSFYNNGTFKRTNILPGEILNFKNSQSSTGENFNQMPMQRMSVGNQPPIRLMNRFRRLIGLNQSNQSNQSNQGKKQKGKKREKYGGSKKEKSSGKSTFMTEAEENELLNSLFEPGYGEGKSSSPRRNHFNSWYGFENGPNSSLPLPSQSLLQSRSLLPSISSLSSGYSYDPELYGNSDPLSSLLAHASPSAVAASSIPEPIDPYNRRPHGLNQRAWFEMPEKPKNSRKKSVTIAPKSKKRSVPKYRSSGMHKTHANNAAGHQINGYEFENNVNSEGNPIVTSSYYSEDSNVNTK